MGTHATSHHEHHQSKQDLTRAELATLRRALLAEQKRLRASAAIPSVVREAVPREADRRTRPPTASRSTRPLPEAGTRSYASPRSRPPSPGWTPGPTGRASLSGEPIGYARLSAVPWARLTAAEQEERDRLARA